MGRAPDHHPLGYVEQLYTFADRDRAGDDAPRVISISYLGLTREDAAAGDEAELAELVPLFPLGGPAGGAPAMIARLIAPRLRAWAERRRTPACSASAGSASRVTFGLDDRAVERGTGAAAL